MAKRTDHHVDRRGFLKGAAVGAAALVTPAVPEAQPAAPPRTGTPLPSNAQLAADTGDPPPRVSSRIIENPGSDFMVDVIKRLGFEYVAANPGSSFEGLHESIINYGSNKTPELLTCCHEESSVAMAHGYAKIEGKPIMVMAHGTVGLQHASMAVYNAYADRVPVLIVVGNIPVAQVRRSHAEWAHAVQDAAAMVRDYTKWDDTPVSLTHFGESAAQAYRMATTPPYGPVVLVADAALQELGSDQVSFGYVTATIPATTTKQEVPTIGFIAHVDTSPEMSGASVKPIVHQISRPGLCCAT